MKKIFDFFVGLFFCVAMFIDWPAVILGARYAARLPYC